MRLSVVLAVALAGVPAAHAAPTIETAKAALDASDYPGARQQLNDVLARGNNGPAELAEIYRLLGVAAAAVGDANAATDAFARCLALAPKTTLPDGTSPKITKPFAAAKAKVKSPLAIKAEARSTALLVQTVHDPMDMVVRFRVTVRVDGKLSPTIEKPAAEEMEIAVPTGARTDVWVAAVDKHGNRLAEVGSSDVPLVIVGNAKPDVKPDGKPDAKPDGKPDGKPDERVAGTPIRTRTVVHERPLILQWWLWGGMTVLAGAATTYFGMQAIDGRDSLQTMTDGTPNWDEFQSTRSRTERNVLITNIGFGVTGVFGLAAAILFVTRPSPSVEPMPVEGGAGVAMRGRF